MKQVTLTRIFDWSWRIAILSLPWQTRWIVRAGTLAGHPWEQGTIAVYGSWVLMGLAIVVGVWTLKPTFKTSLANQRRLWIAAGLLVVISLLTASRVATVLWWSHVLILTLFVWTLVRAGISSTALARWFVLALVPQAALGVWQFFTQDVIGSSILGMATQHPWDSGVSVVEHGLYRVLRVYGGFPHPNVFGGWLALGLVLLPGLARRSRSKLETYGLLSCALLFSAALTFTFSRGAWLAVIIGVVSSIVIAHRESTVAADRQAVWLVTVVMILAAGFCVVTQWDHVATRFHPQERLERWSIEQRTTSLRDGLRLVTERPLVGWGPGASLVGLARSSTAGQVSIAPEPPHFVPLIMLAEIGVLGLLSICLFSWFLIRQSAWRRRWRSALPVLAVAVIICATDHYPWTLWAGQSLFAFILAWVMCAAMRTDTSGSSTD